MSTKPKKADPESLHGRAMDNLEFIRDTMQRSSEFTAVPGYGGVLMGATAIGAAVIASFQTDAQFWLLTWLVEALLAVAIGVLAMWQKSKAVSTALTSLPARKFAMGFAPPLAAAIVITAFLTLNGQITYLPVVWLSLYGTSVVTGGAYSIKAVPIMGWLFICLGAIAVFLPPAAGNVLMGIGFGFLHIVFGLVIGKKYGG